MDAAKIPHRRKPRPYCANFEKRLRQKVAYNLKPGRPTLKKRCNTFPECRLNLDRLPVASRQKCMLAIAMKVQKKWLAGLSHWCSLPSRGKCTPRMVRHRAPNGAGPLCQSRIQKLPPIHTKSSFHSRPFLDMLGLMLAFARYKSFFSLNIAAIVILLNEARSRLCSSHQSFHSAIFFFHMSPCL